MVNKIISLITGGAQGLGRGFAESILKRGGMVSIIDSNKEQGEITSSEFTKIFGPDKVIFNQGNVTNSDDLKSVFSKTINKFGSLNLVINNAGVATHDSKNWRKTIDINLTALIEGCELAVTYMPNGGHIVNIASAAGLLPVFFDPVYSASKFGVVGYSQSLALFLKRKEIRVNCLCPEFVDTPLVTENMQNHPILAKVVNRKPIMSVSDVVIAFDKLIDCEETNGEVLYITSDKGIQSARAQLNLDYKHVSSQL